MADISVYPDAAALAEAAAERFVALAAEAIARYGRFAVALSGGSTPRAMYARLAVPDEAMRIEWDRVHVFFGDERCVPPENPDSNYHMVREALLNRVPIPRHCVHRIRGEIDPQEAAHEYEAAVGRFFAARADAAARGRPRFDLILLGLGEDGHTASLFPGSPALQEKWRWVVAAHAEHLGQWRVTLTPAVINAAANVVFLVSGEAKRERLWEVLEGAYRPEELPAQVVSPTDGALLWMVDAAAGGR
jgi:6-phosphogluconolactonase